MHRKISYLLFIVILILSICFSILFGSSNINLYDILNVFVIKIQSIIDNDSSILDASPTYQIVWNIRLPRILFGMICGIGLAISGTVMQSLVRNPIADPYILGISSGASAGAAIALLLPIPIIFAQFQTTVFAFAGALISSALVYGIASKAGNDKLAPTTLILSGIAINAVMSALTSLLIFLAKSHEGIASIYNWQMGSLASSQWQSIPLPLITTTLGFIICLKYAKELNILMMGDEDAIALGIEVNKVKIILFVTCALISASIVSVTGVIGFVGLVIPHVTRLIFKTSDNRVIIPLSALIGAIYLIWADAFARSMFGAAELPIGILTALIGAPFFMYLLSTNKRKYE
ncbi:MAG: iron chelate uptake ABC transporter family permease subunit [Erysipelotrichales bacterium]